MTTRTRIDGFLPSSSTRFAQITAPRTWALAVDVVMWLGFRAVRRRRSAESETD